MENKEHPISICDIIDNSRLRGSLYSTFKCSVCGKKLIASGVVDELHFTCEEYHVGMRPPGETEHDLLVLSLKEIAAILNFNPLL